MPATSIARPCSLDHHASVAQQLHRGAAPALGHHPARERVAGGAGVVVSQRAVHAERRIEPRELLEHRPLAARVGDDVAGHHHHVRLLLDAERDRHPHRAQVQRRAAGVEVRQVQDREPVQLRRQARNRQHGSSRLQPLRLEQTPCRQRPSRRRQGGQRRTPGAIRHARCRARREDGDGRRRSVPAASRPARHPRSGRFPTRRRHVPAPGTPARPPRLRRRRWRLRSIVAFGAVYRASQQADHSPRPTRAAPRSSAASSDACAVLGGIDSVRAYPAATSRAFTNSGGRPSRSR